MRTLFLLAASTAALAGLLGCTGSRIQYVDDGGSYTRDSATTLLESTSPGELAEAPSNEAPRLRQRALTRLRDLGGTAKDAASVITRSFPSDSDGVPYRVERASFGGKDALVILEARGRSGGPLSDRLLWVIDGDGTVLYSVMR